MKPTFFAALALIMLSCAMTTSALAWNGTDVTTGTTVRIENRDAVRSGGSIELFDSSSGRYHDVDVDSVTGTDDVVRLQVYDYDTSQLRTLEMQR